MKPSRNITRARAPLRIGLAGGGTDLSPYCDEYGGMVLNATIGLYAHTTIIPEDDNVLRFLADDIGKKEALDPAPELELVGDLRMHRAVYNRIVRDYNGGVPLRMSLSTSVECPQGSGLGASSALVVSMIEAYREWLGLPMGRYDIARMACEIERADLDLSGGRQDQYAATFGGINFFEFYADERVIVNPLQLSQAALHELESSLLLFFTGSSRLSSNIIDQQVSAIKSVSTGAMEAMHRIRQDALDMKSVLLRNETSRVADILNRSWEAKKATSNAISNSHIDEMMAATMRAGAKAGKISGAGGGGFMMVFVDPVRRDQVRQEMQERGMVVLGCNFAQHGAFGWQLPSLAATSPL